MPALTGAAIMVTRLLFLSTNAVSGEATPGSETDRGAKRNRATIPSPLHGFIPPRAFAPAMVRAHWYSRDDKKENSFDTEFH
jgi:hypothetical protein